MVQKVSVLVSVLLFLFCAVSYAENEVEGTVDEGKRKTYSPTRAVQIRLMKNLRSSHIHSPKSAIFYPDGSKFYINALEGKETLVYDSATLQLRKVIPHAFSKDTADLFYQNENTVFGYTYHNCFGTGDKNLFNGKPVECTFTHGGKYLWVSYYRRECDANASSPSALAIIDTERDEIVRVLPTPPLPKMVVASPDGRRVAVTNWGDNTVCFITIEGDDPMRFAYERQLVVGSRLPVANIKGDRDSACGLCLRASAFTKDSQYFLVAGMRSASIHVFHVETGKHVGSVQLPVPNPRHFVVSPDGTKLYVSFNVPGKVGELQIADILEKAPTRRSVTGRFLSVGKGTRTIAISEDGARLYAVCNLSSSITCIDTASWRILGSAPVAPYGVGLALNASETMALVTSQGRQGHGGNTVGVFSIEK